MSREVDLLDVVGRAADERLLTDDAAQLPESLHQPGDLPAGRARGPIVAVGAALTGTTLIGGLGLIVFAIVELISSGLDATSIVALIAGVVLVATHWGWVHVAEVSANALERRRNRELTERRHRWLAEVEPYSRWSVSTSAGEDGSIAIVTERHTPVPVGERTFTFRRAVQEREVHSGDEPAAAVAERAEELRRRAAAATADERDRYEVANDAFQRTLLARDDEEQRVAALRAASEALSERLNAHLRDPPLSD
jgi:hypothetical protein